jgi:hypothetical protein
MGFQVDLPPPRYSHIAKCHNQSQVGQSFYELFDIKRESGKFRVTWHYAAGNRGGAAAVGGDGPSR